MEWQLLRSQPILRESFREVLNTLLSSISPLLRTLKITPTKKYANIELETYIIATHHILENMNETSENIIKRFKKELKYTSHETAIRSIKDYASGKAQLREHNIDEKYKEAVRLINYFFDRHNANNPEYNNKIQSIKICQEGLEGAAKHYMNTANIKAELEFQLTALRLEFIKRNKQAISEINPSISLKLRMIKNSS